MDASTWRCKQMRIMTKRHIWEQVSDDCPMPVALAYVVMMTTVGGIEVGPVCTTGIEGVGHLIAYLAPVEIVTFCASNETDPELEKMLGTVANPAEIPKTALHRAFDPRTLN